jgi:hypothetical protein
MRLVHAYLSGYFLLLFGALFALWNGDVLRRLSPLWVLLALLVSVGLGVLLAATAQRPPSHE